MVKLKTLAKGVPFDYTGSIESGLSIKVGSSRYPIKVSPDILKELVTHFSGKTTAINATRTVHDLMEGSLGHWLNIYVSGPVITSYIAAMLVHEGYADFIDHKLVFKNMAIWDGYS